MPALQMFMHDGHASMQNEAQILQVVCLFCCVEDETTANTLDFLVCNSTASAATITLCFVYLHFAHTRANVTDRK